MKLVDVVSALNSYFCIDKSAFFSFIYCICFCWESYFLVSFFEADLVFVFSKLGHLRNELMRAERWVVDTVFIYYQRWTREQAMEYRQCFCKSKFTIAP